MLCACSASPSSCRSRSTQDTGLDGLRQTDLVRILDDVTERADRLRTEARDLEDTRARVTAGSGGTRAALEEAQDRARVLGVLAGTLPATGPGIELTISDPDGKVGADVLLDTLQELRDAGAEAVEISPLDGPAVRVVAGTSFVDADRPRPAGTATGPGRGRRDRAHLAVPVPGDRRPAHPRGGAGHPGRRPRRAAPGATRRVW